MTSDDGAPDPFSRKGCRGSVVGAQPSSVRSRILSQQERAALHTWIGCSTGSPKAVVSHHHSTNSGGCTSPQSPHVTDSWSLPLFVSCSVLLGLIVGLALSLALAAAVARATG